MMNLEKWTALAMVKIVRPASVQGDDFTSIDVDETDVDFEELVRAAICGDRQDQHSLWRLRLPCLPRSTHF
jgi:hypothetical protein